VKYITTRDYNGRILGIGWAQLSDRLDAYVKESEGGGGKG
jgi:hypothetical protein